MDEWRWRLEEGSSMMDEEGYREGRSRAVDQWRGRRRSLFNRRRQRGHNHKEVTTINKKK
jgi:hypothetical protein